MCARLMVTAVGCWVLCVLFCWLFWFVCGLFCLYVGLLGTLMFA